ncbi:MAG: hypothetical protein ACE361_16045 [Aureliella sp.]
MSSSPRDPEASRTRGCLWKVFVAVAAIFVLITLPLFWIYGTHTHHASRDSIWWSERGRSLIPPAAKDITLHQDILDHYATYKITERELNAFLDRRFARNGETLDSFGDRTPAATDKIGTEIGPLKWTVTKDTVVYTYYASNGGAHDFFHDTRTGKTYQSSAYW